MIVFVALALLLIGSVSLKVNNKRRKYRFAGSAFPVEPSSSFLSEAIVELLGVAGGIYLALIMVAAFLQVDLSEKFILGNMKLDPLAVLSLTLALCHPFCSRVWSIISGK